MITLSIIFAILALSINARTTTNVDKEIIQKSICNNPPARGICRGSFQRYYYNITTQSCKTFKWGGCGGNKNNFKALKDCESVCMSTVKVNNGKPETCNLDPVVGPCRALMERYFFNKATGVCEKFYYGGCLGNNNNFRTIIECKKSCE